MKKTKYLLFSAVLLASMQSVAQNPINDNPAYSIVGKDSTCQVFIYSPADNHGDKDFDFIYLSASLPLYPSRNFLYEGTFIISSSSLPSNELPSKKKTISPSSGTTFLY